MSTNQSLKLIKKLKDTARKARLYTIKTALLSETPLHLGGALSMIDILTVLYFVILKIRPSNPEWNKRDRFILSKGHAGLGLFSILALKKYFPLKELFTINLPGSRLVTHLDFKTPGVDMATGSLGQGLSVGVGMAMGAKLDREKYRVYVLLGDGEVDSGQIWEAAMTAAKYKLDNLVAIIDFNKLQLDGKIEDIMPIEPLSAKWRAFNWEVIEIDGHNFHQILKAFQKANEIKGRPTLIIANTIKCKGLPFLESKKESHRLIINTDELKYQINQALKILNR
jgi:transketolase